MPTIDNKLEPVGSLKEFPVNSVPDGWMKGTGAFLNKIAFASLYAFWGNQYGSTSTTFGTPDYRGLFLRTLDESHGNNPDNTAIGVIQGCQIQTHSHGMGSINAGSSNYSNNDGDITHPVFNTANYIGNETRPINMSVIVCFKY